MRRISYRRGNTIVNARVNSNTDLTWNSQSIKDRNNKPRLFTHAS